MKKPQIHQTLLSHDPSRYVVYQMLNYAIKKLQLTAVSIQKSLPGLYLSKTEPYVNSLYNYAHVLTDTISTDNLQEIKDFFGDAPFRVKIFENKRLENFFLENEFQFKDTGNIMIAKDLKEFDLDSDLKACVRIVKIRGNQGLDDYKSIFTEAFGCTLEDTNNKFGFLDKTMVNDKDNHINAFVLYENEIPVSTGAYYAFDRFSIENIGTLKSSRGKGYAYEIMKCLMREAKNLKYTEACLVASDSGANVYKKVGFQLIRKTKTFVP